MRVGQVERGGKWNAVAQSRRGGGDQRVAADTAGSDFNDITNRAAQLARQRIEIVSGWLVLVGHVVPYS